LGDNTFLPGAFAEWMAAAVAGVSLDPTTTGGRTALFWPRFPKSAATIQYASAIQGTARGDFAIAWRFELLPTSEFTVRIVSVNSNFIYHVTALNVIEFREILFEIRIVPVDFVNFA